MDSTREKGQKQNKKNTRTMFISLLIPLLLLFLMEVILFLGAMSGSGLVSQLNQYAQLTVNEKTENRANSVENSMSSSWGDLSSLAMVINAAAEELVEDGSIQLKGIETNTEDSNKLLSIISEDMISTLRIKRSSGIFVIFNTENLSREYALGEFDNRTGLYIRDLDPVSAPSHKNEDLLLERGPSEIVKALNISTNSNWRPMFSFGTDGGNDDISINDFFYRPFTAAYKFIGVPDVKKYGFWGVAPFANSDGDRFTVTYTVPLVLSDGTVYGVLGIDFLADYIRKIFPSSELFEKNKGMYVLAVNDESIDSQEEYTAIVTSGEYSSPIKVGDKIVLTESEEGGYFFNVGDTEYYAAKKVIPLYGTDTPFEKEHWTVLGAVRTKDLYEFSDKIIKTIVTMTILMLVLGIIGCIFISRAFSKPIKSLSDEVEMAQDRKDALPVLPKTNIREIDQFAEAITSLSRDVIKASTRFLKIMDMASIDIAGFEVNRDEDYVYVTDNFYPMFELHGINAEKLTLHEFFENTRKIIRTYKVVRGIEDEKIYRVPRQGGGVRYVRMNIIREGRRKVGVAEDVTATMLERLRIEKERDYDILTGLLNRRAFYREVEELFEAPDKLRSAAVLMLDLDNLKTVNDKFGHDWGDQYIRKAGNCFLKGLPDGAICARVSGDEFLILLYGYENREEIRTVLSDFSDKIKEADFIEPDGCKSKIMASGGVAWYPEDAKDFKELIRMADFAMYQVKNSGKGRLEEFDIGVYNQQSHVQQRKKEFQELIKNESVQYHFQPIVDARTGKIAAYEALLRVSMPTINSPETLITLAHKEGKLAEIEHMTWFKAAEFYRQLLERKQVDEEAYLFINSIAGQNLSADDMVAFAEKNGDLQARIVVEITESEHMDASAMEMKRRMPGFSGMFALDDYGSGYNSERSLLDLAPKFVKVDMTIIRDIDTDENKQEIVANIVRYAHQRDMLIIAEGVETTEEVRMVMELGVDMMQGYFFAKPAAVPMLISNEALNLMESFASGFHKEVIA